MKSFIILLILSTTIFSQVVDSDKSKILSVYTEYALENCPTLLYHAYIINNNYGKLEQFKEATKLFNLEKTIYEHERGKYIDSIIQKINNSSLNSLRKKKILEVLSEYEKEMTDNIELKVRECQSLKIKLNYDDNHERYFEYSYVTDNLSAPYDSAIDYQVLFNNLVSKFNTEIKAKTDEFASLKDNDQSLLIEQLLSNWLLIKSISPAERIDIYNLLLTQNQEGFNVENGFIINLSVPYILYSIPNPVHDIFNEDKYLSTTWNNKYTSYFNLALGYRLKIKEEKNSFSWMELTAGFSWYNLMFNEKSIYRGTGYDAKKGGYEQYLDYVQQTKKRFNASFHFSLNTPIFYLYSSLYLSSGFEIYYINLSGDYNISVNKENRYRRRDYLETFYLGDYNYNEEVKEFRISPTVNINYELFKNLTLSFQLNLNMPKLTLSTVI